MLNVDLEKSRVYEFRGGQDVVERPNVNASRPNLICSGKADIWRSPLGAAKWNHPWH